MQSRFKALSSVSYVVAWFKVNCWLNHATEHWSELSSGSLVVGPTWTNFWRLTIRLTWRLAHVGSYRSQLIRRAHKFGSPIFGIILWGRTCCTQLKKGFSSMENERYGKILRHGSYPLILGLKAVPVMLLCGNNLFLCKTTYILT
jgi:hypothetical protein